MARRNIVVIGAGLAGLCAARTLQRAGHNAVVYEASDGVGGRVRTDVVDGFRLDRGFQVLFTAYPACRQELDFPALDLRAFEPGAMIFLGGQRHFLSDPLRVPRRAATTALSPLFGLRDKWLTARLSVDVMRRSVDDLFSLPDQTMGEFLTDYGFSPAFLDRFIRPFYAGVFLEDRLETSARMFAFVFKMLAQGQTVLPANGMGAIPAQIAADLVPGSLHLGRPVAELTYQGSVVAGVRLADGATIQADRVIVATEFDRAAQLTGLNLPAVWRMSSDLSFALPARPFRERLIALFADPNALVNNCSVVSNVAPAYAPDGQHLLSCTVLGDRPETDAELADKVRTELQTRFPHADTRTWRLLRVWRAKWAQYAQPPGIWERLPDPQTPRPGLILAGEITVSSSLDGALKSGQRAAALAMQDNSSQWLTLDENG